MTLVKWNNTALISDNLNQWFNLVTNDVYQNDLHINDKWTPNFEIMQNNDHYIINAEIAGLSKKDITIEIDGELLKISGERSSVYNNDDAYTNRYSEINYGSFIKSFRLPENTMENKISAKMNNGILFITIPTIKPVIPETKKIKIN